MEFKLKKINNTLPVTIHFLKVRDNTSALQIEHNGTMYNSLFDDILYLYGSVARYISNSDILDFFTGCDSLRNKSGIPLHVNISYPYHYNDMNFVNLLCSRNNFRQMFIREPEDPNNLLIVEKEKIVNKEIIIEKEIEVIRDVIHTEVKELDDLEDCCICYDSKAYISFGCCSLKQCIKCAVKVLNTNKCPQCRGVIDPNKLEHTLFPSKDKNTVSY